MSPIPPTGFTAGPALPGKCMIDVLSVFFFMHALTIACALEFLPQTAPATTRLSITLLCRTRSKSGVPALRQSQLYLLTFRTKRNQQHHAPTRETSWASGRSRQEDHRDPRRYATPRDLRTSFATCSRGLQKDPLPSQFTCLFCNHENAVTVKLDKKAGVGQLDCRICGQKFQCAVNCMLQSEPLATLLEGSPADTRFSTDLSAAVDVYGEWVDAAGMRQTLHYSRLGRPANCYRCRREGGRRGTGLFWDIEGTDTNIDEQDRGRRRL